MSDDFDFAQRMRARRTGKVICPAGCKRLVPPAEIVSGECPACLDARLREEARERRRREEEEERKRQAIAVEEARKRIERLKAAPLGSLNRSDLLAVCVADGAMSPEQAKDIEIRGDDVERYSMDRIRGVLETHRRLRKERESVNRERIMMATPSRIGKTRQVLSDALSAIHRLGEGGGRVMLVVANEASRQHYETQIQALVPHAVKMADGAWSLNGAELVVSVHGSQYRGRAAKKTVVDPQVEREVHDPSARYRKPQGML